VNETAETIPASDRRCGHWDNAHWESHIDHARREKLKASLRSLVVVVPRILVENTFKVTPTPDQYPVQALLPYGSSYPPLGERVGVRRLDRRRDDLDAVGCEDFVEGTGELAVAVAKEEPRRAGSRCPLFFPAHRELPYSLDDPRPVRMGSDASESNPPGPKLDQ
jgi:hypothetical protein